LSEQSSSIALGGPLGLLDGAFLAQRTSISDGNQRSTLQGVLRWPLLSGVTLVTSVTGIWFEQRSELYWDPVSYVAGAAGLEYSVRQSQGVSLAVRALAGPARSVERIEDRESGIQVDELPHSALQLSGGAELSYRTGAGELGAALAYGSGRAGDYRRLEAMVYARRQR
jgi:hypothetical protein